MSPSDLQTRETANADFLARLESPRPERPRKTISNPKPLTVQVGDVLIYPADVDGPVNPYMSERLLGVSPFRPKGWGALVLAETGYAFDFLPWVGVRRIGRMLAHKPTMGSLTDMPLDDHIGYGTLQPLHMRRMQMEKIGRRTLERPEPEQTGGHADGPYCALHDIGVTNHLSNRV